MQRRTDFIAAIGRRQMVLIEYRSKKSGAFESRTCAPLDFGPLRRTADGIDRFHFWDYDGSRGGHVASIEAQQVTRVEVVGHNFDPSDIVTWDVRQSPWHVERDWGSLS